jgi:hypothetical protein
VGVAALWATVAFFEAYDGGAGRPEPSDLYPAVAFAIVGPVVGVLVLWRLLRRAEVLEPSEPASVQLAEPADTVDVEG